MRLAATDVAEGTAALRSAWATVPPALKARADTRGPSLGMRGWGRRTARRLDHKGLRPDAPDYQLAGQVLVPCRAGFSGRSRGTPPSWIAPPAQELIPALGDQLAELSELRDLFLSPNVSCVIQDSL
jgi:hypothetical protein